MQTDSPAPIIIFEVSVLRGGKMKKEKFEACVLNLFYSIPQEQRCDFIFYLRTLVTSEEQLHAAQVRPAIKKR